MKHFLLELNMFAEGKNFLKIIWFLNEISNEILYRTCLDEPFAACFQIYFYQKFEKLE